MSSTDYKIKYLDIRAKLIEVQDVAWRDGYEKGLKEGEQAAQQAALQEQQMMEQQMMQAQGGMPPEAQGGMPPEAQGGMPPEAQGGMEGEIPSGMETAQPPMDEEQGSELDQHINELEQLVQKGEKPSVVSVRKIVEQLSGLRKNQKEKYSNKVIQTTSSQKKLVDNILKKWEKESEKISSNLEEIIKENE